MSSDNQEITRRQNFRVVVKQEDAGVTIAVEPFNHRSICTISHAGAKKPARLFSS